MMSKILLTMLLALTALTTQAAEPRPLRVGVAPKFEPVAFKVSGQLQGIEIDFANKLAIRLQRPVEFHEYPFSDLIPALERGEIDVIMSGMSITEARREHVRFTRPYMDIGQMAVVRTADASTYGQPGALREDGLRVGVQKGSTGEAWVTSHLAHANVIAYEGAEAGLAALRAGNIDVFIHDSTTSWQLGRSFINDKLMSLSRFLTSESVGWAVRKDAPELQTTLDLILKDMKSGGEVKAVLKKWLPVSPAAI